LRRKSHHVSAFDFFQIFGEAFVVGGDFRTPKTRVVTANIATPPVVYATSLPPHQNREQNNIGPAALPN
jgi:hypothetical protein